MSALSVAQMVRDFNETAGLPVNDTVQESVSHDGRYFRLNLISEEAREANRAIRDDDTVAVAGELADLVYVAYGAAHHWGIDLDAVIAAVHEANMRKAGPDGTFHYRADGKVMKPPGWEPADIAQVLGL